MERILYRGVVYSRNPDAEQRPGRVYYAPPRGSSRDLLHRDVYRDHHGPIPEGWHVHHEDGDPLNNDPGNLVALSPADHAQRHAPEYAEQRRAHMDRIRPLAAAWHSTEEGLAWHSEHGRRTWEGRVPDRIECVECGETAERFFDARFCSRRCSRRQADREGRYVVTVTCPICGAAFEQSKYRPQPETCSRRCGAALRKRRRAGLQP